MPRGRCGAGAGSFLARGGFVHSAGRRFSQAAARWRCRPGSVPGPGAGRQCLAFSPRPPQPQEPGARSETKARCSPSFIFLKSQSRGWSGKGKGRHRESRVVKLRVPVKPRRNLCSFAFPVLCLVSFWLLPSVPDPRWSSKPRTTSYNNHSFTNPRKVPCGERLSFALARGTVTLRTSPWCKWKTPAL